MLPVLILPGLGGSGPEHWQTHWETKNPDFIRVEQGDWDNPDLDEWVATLDGYIARQPAPPLLVAHSLSCALVAHWAERHHRRVHGALLVAPSDVDSPAHTPAEVRGFSPMPLQRLPGTIIVVASEDDPYVDFARAEFFAQSWGARFVNAGKCGHINSASGLGDWRLGQRTLAELADEKSAFSIRT
jgi:predicted alpha/beta hydrolase family esterase